MDAGLTAGEERSNIIGFEGSGLTTDHYIRVVTEWYDWDGAPLPDALPGYTGRLAKVVAENTLQADGQIAQFEIKPGRRTQIVKLPEADIDNAHFYIHVSGQPVDQNPDFSTIGAGNGPLQYRPSHYAPVKVSIYDEQSSLAAKQAYEKAIENGVENPPEPKPVYNWVYRPEMQFSLFDLDLNLLELYDKNSSATVPTQIITIGSNLDSLAQMIQDDVYFAQLFYDLEAGAYSPLTPLGVERQLVFALGDQELYAQIGCNGKIMFDNLDDINLLERDNYLALRLYQNGDDANLLWEYAFSSIDIDVDSDNSNGLLGGPDSSPVEDNIEKSQAKLVVVNNGDNDNDHLPDFVDFQNSANFASIKITIPASWNYASTRISFQYPGSDPSGVTINGSDEFPVYQTAEGYLRLWRRNGSETRNNEAIISGGDYIAPGQNYTLAQLGVTNQKGPYELTYYMEGVRKADNDILILCSAVDVGGQQASDSVMVRVAELNIEGPPDDALRITAGTADLENEDNPRMPNLEFKVELPPQVESLNQLVTYQWQFMIEYLADTPANPAYNRDGLQTVINGERDGIFVSGQNLPASFGAGSRQARNWFVANAEYNIAADTHPLKIIGNNKIRIENDCAGCGEDEPCIQWADRFGGGFIYAAVKVQFKNPFTNAVEYERYLTWGVGKCSSAQCEDNDFAQRKMLLADAPSQDTIKAYIDALMPELYETEPIGAMGATVIPEQSRLTFAQAGGLFKGIAGRETNYQPFAGYYYNPAVCPWMRNGWPTIADDGGFGMYQLTNGKFGPGPHLKPTYSQVWNWKKNLDGAVYLINNSKAQKYIDDAALWLANGPDIAYMEPNEFLRDLLARYNGGTYFDFRAERLDNNQQPIDVSTIVSDRIGVMTGSTYAIQFPFTGYYRDLRFCDHRNTPGVGGDVGRETDPAIPQDDIEFCSGEAKLNLNSGFGFANEDGMNNHVYTGQATASECQGSSSCYADRRDCDEPELDPNTPPIRYGVHATP